MSNGYLDAYRSRNSASAIPGNAGGNSRLETYRVAAPQRAEEDKKRKEEERKRAAERLAAETKRKQEEERNKPWYQKGIEGVIKGFSAPEITRVAGDAGNFVKSVTVDPAVTLYKQANIGAANNQGVSPEAVKNQAKFLDSQVKEGKITQQEADKRKAKNQKQADINIKAVQAEEKKQGVKRDQDAGVMALLDTAGNLSGLGAIAKGSAKLGAEAGKTLLSKRVARNAADEPVDNIPSAITATKNAPVLPTKPTPIPETTQVRSSAYQPSETPRITKQEAAEKLKTAGYTTDESLTILEDALPEKGLSMPGSPKNIKLNDASIQKAAANFDEVNAPPTSTNAPLTEQPITPTTEGSTLKPLASIDGTAEQGVSKLGKSTQDSAVYDKIIKKTEAETAGLPTYNKANMQQQAQYATELIKGNPQEAIDIAMGRKAAPEHVLQQMVYNAVEDHATKIGGEQGGKLLLDLSKSRQSTNLTKMGQEIRAAAERDPHSPVTMMDEVRLARAEAAKKRGKDISKAAKEDAAAIKKATPKVKKEDWDSFIKSIEC